ncbi:ankyrin repeat domain-containing protein [Parashewanella tropica]|uniref:ankyrin repeat domain-containing protein n=1 Tax=Parashewanella tropica TaxID=2547970 RepID=UPI001059B28C|nr:ankyrin repeat domain-containing protein [Parashewanella tropica]
MSASAPPEFNLQYVITNNYAFINCSDLTQIAHQDGKSVTFTANGLTQTYNVSSSQLDHCYFDWKIKPQGFLKFFIDKKHKPLVEFVKRRLFYSVNLILLIKDKKINDVFGMFSVGANLDAFYVCAPYETPLYAAVDYQNEEVASRLLKEGASPNTEAMKGGLTPLHIAAYKGNKNIVRLLLAYHANHSALDLDGKPPRMVAKHQGHHEIVAMLEAKLEEDPKIVVGTWAPKQDKTESWAVIPDPKKEEDLSQLLQECDSSTEEIPVHTKSENPQKPEDSPLEAHTLTISETNQNSEEPFDNPLYQEDEVAEETSGL